MIQCHADVLAIRCRHTGLYPVDAGIFQINPQLPGGGFEGRMPFQIETFDAAQDAVGIFVGGNITERKAVGRDKSGGVILGVKAVMTLPALRICSAKKSSDSIRLPSAI